MTWRYQPDAMPDTLTATPREVNAILRAYADEMSGHVDRDNIGNKVVTSAKFATNAIRQVVSYPEEADTPTTITLTLPKNGNATGWQTVKEITIDTLDAWLDIDTNATIVAISGTQRAAVQIAIAIDDVIVAESAPSACHYNDGSLVVEGLRVTQAITSAVPVQAGAHRVALLANLRVDTNLLGGRGITASEIPYFWICAVEHNA